MSGRTWEYNRQALKGLAIPQLMHRLSMAEDRTVFVWEGGGGGVKATVCQRPAIKTVLSASDALCCVLVKSTAAPRHLAQRDLAA